jgi:hypothetical protein
MTGSDVPSMLREIARRRSLESHDRLQSVVGGQGAWPPDHHHVDGLCGVDRRRRRGRHRRDPRGDEPHEIESAQNVADREDRAA